MAHLKEVEDRIVSVGSIQKITKAMKLIAASKLYNVQQRRHHLIPYVEKLTDIFYHIVGNIIQSQLKNSYFEQRKVKKILIIAIAADRGLCGSFNKNVFKKTMHYIGTEHSVSNEGIAILAIGKKTVQFFSKKELHLISTYVDLTTLCNAHFTKVDEATKNIMQLFQQGIYDRIVLIYNSCKNSAQYETEVVPFLPLIPHNNNISRLGINFQNTIYEPSRPQIIENIVPDLLKMKLYKALIESNAAEHLSRMITMSKATDNADALLKELRLTYNRRRQNLITRAIAEIVNGSEGLVE